MSAFIFYCAVRLYILKKGLLKVRYSAVFFDLDGTLLDTLGDLTAAVNHVLETLGYPTRTKKEIRSFIGDGFALLIKRACPADADPGDTEKAYTLFADHYSRHIADTTLPYDGILDLVDRLYEEGYPMAVVSNKRDDAVKFLVKEFFGEKISVALGERGGNTRKPSPVLCFEAAEMLDVPCESVLYAGDSPSDVQTALNAGMIPLAVTWGFRTKEQLAGRGASLFADTAEELYALIAEGYGDKQ